MFKKKKKKLVCLLGSGFSIPVGMPSTNEITKNILTGNSISRNQESIYYLGNPMFSEDPAVPMIRNFISALVEEIESYYGRIEDFRMSYEDIFQIADEIYSSLCGRFYNPAVMPLANKIAPSILKIRCTLPGSSLFENNWNVEKVAWETINYIRDMVWGFLYRASKAVNRRDLKYLDGFINFCKDPDFSPIEIFTLNHDTILELAFNRGHISYTDGFKKEIGGNRIWDPLLFTNNKANVRIMKLHGSIDWFSLYNSAANRKDMFCVDINGFKYVDKVYLENEVAFAPKHHPNILTGTYNKILEYPFGVYIDLVYRFHQVLKESECIVVCGYGLRDMGINAILLTWLFKNDANRIILIEPYFDYRKKDMLSSFWWHWQSLNGSNKLVVIRGGIESVDWHDIRKLFLQKI